MYGDGIPRNMPDQATLRRAWLSGFATGVAVSGLAVYAARKLRSDRPRVIRDEGTVIPID